jgi:hypothetical protein
MHNFIAVGCLIGFVAMCILAVIHVLYEKWREGPYSDSDSHLFASPQEFQLSRDIGAGSSDSAEPMESPPTGHTAASNVVLDSRLTT